MPASITNLRGVTIYGTAAELASLLGLMSGGGAKIVNAAGVNLVVVAQPITRAQLPADAQPATAVTARRRGRRPV